MKPLQRLLCFSASSCLAIAALAQDPALPTNTDAQATRARDSATSEPGTSPSPTPPATSIEPPQLIPSPPLPPSGAAGSAFPPLPADPADLSKLDALFLPTAPSREARGYQLLVQWRQLENQTTNDPAVVKARAFAEAAPTDLEKRERLRVYYRLYYAKMGALATTPELKGALAGQLGGHLGTLDQPRVRPAPTPGPSPKPSLWTAPAKPAH